jgi:low temperature requirement protein LtrA
MAVADGVPASVVPDIPYVRRGEGERRATYFELFFDLVYVFGVTQLSHHLLGFCTGDNVRLVGVVAEHVVLDLVVELEATVAERTMVDDGIRSS